MTPSRSQRKRVAFEMSNKSHTSFVLKPACLEGEVRFFTLRMRPRKTDLNVYKAKYSQYALPVKQTARSRVLEEGPGWSAFSMEVMISEDLDVSTPLRSPWLRGSLAGARQ